MKFFLKIIFFLNLPRMNFQFIFMEISISHFSIYKTSKFYFCHYNRKASVFLVIFMIKQESPTHPPPYNHIKSVIYSDWFCNIIDEDMASSSHRKIKLIFKSESNKILGFSVYPTKFCLKRGAPDLTYIIQNQIR